MAIPARRIGAERDREPELEGLTRRPASASPERQRVGTRISAQSFSAGDARWEGRVGRDRSSPNSFVNSAGGMRGMWDSRGGLGGASSLLNRWGADGLINNAEERQAAFDKGGVGARKPAATARAQGSGPSMLKNPDGTPYDPFNVLAGPSMLKNPDGTPYDPFNVLDGVKPSVAAPGLDDELTSIVDKYKSAFGMGAIPSVFARATGDSVAELAANDPWGDA